VRNTQISRTEPDGRVAPGLRILASDGLRDLYPKALHLVKFQMPLRRIDFVPLLMVVFAIAHGGVSHADTPPQPELQRLEQMITTLASPEFGGRSGAGGEKTAEYLINQFKELKLEPLFEGSYRQLIPGEKPDTFIGRNIGAMVRGSDPSLRDEWVIVAAHYDHLGIRNGKLYPGADDNASGVAMMLEVARCLTTSPSQPKRSLMFIGFDLEEFGLFGSRYFVSHPPVALERVALFITSDMIGRALGGVCRSHVFVIGSEHIPDIRPWIAAGSKSPPLKVGILGSDLLVLNRSDYGPFRSRSIPYLFFTTGENPRYHTPEDTAATLDYPKAIAIVGLILDVTRHAVEAPKLPRWQDQPDNPLAEADTIRDVLKILSDNRVQLKIGSVSTYMIETTLRLLDGVKARGKITPEERAQMIRAARVVLFTVF
jgi:Peptidase family M28/Tetracycline resistance leader peptide